MMRPTPLKRGGRLSPVSSKRKKALAEYYGRRLRYLAIHRTCAAGPVIARGFFSTEPVGLPRCTQVSTQIHHMARRGPNLNDESTWCAICNNCHRWLETHANIARTIGLLR